MKRFLFLMLTPLLFLTVNLLLSEGVGAYPEQFAPGFPPERVPYLFSKEPLPFVLSTTPLAGTEVVRQYTWMRTWLVEPSLYVLKR